MKTYTSKNKYYRLNIPNNWEFEESDECTSFYNQSGVGVLQISAYRVPTNVDVKYELLEYLKDKNIDIEENKLKIQNKNNNKIASYYYYTDKEFYKIWMIFKEKIFLFCTYNCLKGDENIEISTVEEIIESINYIDN